jgi:hypothetical protein
VDLLTKMFFLPHERALNMGLTSLEGTDFVMASEWMQAAVIRRTVWHISLTLTLAFFLVGIFQLRNCELFRKSTKKKKEAWFLPSFGWLPWLFTYFPLTAENDIALVSDPLALRALSSIQCLVVHVFPARAECVFHFININLIL